MNENFQLRNTSDSYFTNFNWEFGDGERSAFAQPEHRYDIPGTYYISLSGTGAICSDTAYQTIVVDPRVLNTFDNAPDSICIGESIRFYSEAHNYTLLERWWTFGDGTELRNTDNEQFVHAYDQAGIMQVVLNSRFRVCPDTSFSRNLYIANLPRISLQADTTLCLARAPITLSNHLLPHASGGYDFLWSTGDTTEAIKVFHPGLYKLTLTQKLLGCNTTESITITNGCYVDIPNAFTPNGDGINDYFFPRQLLSSGVATMHFQIFNRWGQQLFESYTSEGRGWDGRFNNMMQPEGVYVYRIEVRFANDHVETYNGNVTLIR